jgi:peptide/nickel transport system permease protein
MFRFVLTRVLAAIPVLIILSMVTFGIIKAQPGDYADYLKSMLMSQGNVPEAQAQAQADAYRETHGLNAPLPIQYVNWVTGIVTRFDFGDSLYYNKPVGQVVSERLSRTLLLALTCHILASAIGITLGVVAATRQYSWVDTLFGMISFLGMTIPRFLLAIIIIYLLAFKLNVQEIGSFFSARYGGQDFWLGWFNFNWPKLWDLILHIWPVVFIATFGGLAYNMRVMRANLLDVLNAQYVETARAKGLRNSAVILRHAVPNALHPLIAYQGVVLPYMLTGEVEVAIVFGLPTVGPAIVGSLGVGDVWVTATFMLVLAATLLIGNIISDILLALVDPRVRLGGDNT